MRGEFGGVILKPVILQIKMIRKELNMPRYTKDCGTYLRDRYDERWDIIRDKETGEKFWRDKDAHKTYRADTTMVGQILNGTAGSEYDGYDDGLDDWDDDWNEDEDD